MVFFNNIYELLLRYFTITVFIQSAEQFFSLGCVSGGPHHLIHSMDGPEILVILTFGGKILSWEGASMDKLGQTVGRKS